MVWKWNLPCRRALAAFSTAWASAFPAGGREDTQGQAPENRLLTLGPLGMIRSPSLISYPQQNKIGDDEHQETPRLTPVPGNPLVPIPGATLKEQEKHWLEG